MNKVSKFGSVFVALGIILVCLLGSIWANAFNRGFYAQEYHRLNTAESIGMSEEGLMEATNALLDYLTREREDIVVRTEVKGFEREVFNQRETDHMVDVLALYENAKLVIVLFFIIGLCFAFMDAMFVALKKLTFHEVVANLSHGFTQVTVGFAAIVSAIGLYAWMDFNSFWIQFHQLFFSNDLWLLDPRTSIMINMFPEEFFAKMVFRIIASFVISYGVIVLIVAFLKKKIAIKNRVHE